MARYFTAAATASYRLLSDEPIAVTAPTMAMEIPAAIRPYSIDVAPASQRRNRLSIDMHCPCSLQGGTLVRRLAIADPFAARPSVNCETQAAPAL